MKLLMIVISLFLTFSVSAQSSPHPVNREDVKTEAQADLEKKNCDCSTVDRNASTNDTRKEMLEELYGKRSKNEIQQREGEQ